MANYKKQVREYVKNRIDSKVFNSVAEFIKEIDNLLHGIYLPNGSNKYQIIFFKQVRKHLLETYYPELNYFINDGNVVFSEGIYRTQCAQYQNPCDFVGLAKYCEKEYQFPFK